MISPRSHIRLFVRSFLRSFQMEIEFNSHTIAHPKTKFEFQINIEAI